MQLTSALLSLALACSHLALAATPARPAGTRAARGQPAGPATVTGVILAYNYRIGENPQPPSTPIHFHRVLFRFTANSETVYCLNEIGANKPLVRALVSVLAFVRSANAVPTVQLYHEGADQREHMGLSPAEATLAQVFEPGDSQQWGRPEHRGARDRRLVSASVIAAAPRLMLQQQCPEEEILRRLHDRYQLAKLQVQVRPALPFDSAVHGATGAVIRHAAPNGMPTSSKRTTT